MRAAPLLLAWVAPVCLISFCGIQGCAAPAKEGAPGPSEPGASEPEAARPAAPAAPTHPWPTTFRGEALLMAGTVRIEGPPGLRDHVALVQDLDHHTYDTVTTEQGLLQTVEVRDDIPYLAPIRIHLDELTIVAERKIVVLERPGWVPVTVEASGDCFYKRTDSEEEQRGESLRLVGQPR
jgi:hypothetical protein